MYEFLTIKKNVSAEITEKKSKFIANLFYIKNKNEAEEIIKKIKKQHHDARHNCTAYRVIEKDNLIEKSSDDGEPSGTAGAPMLEVLKNSNLCNILIVVTRYFGGILLGTGGLVRAYTECAKNAIANSQIILQCKGIEAEVELSYKELENFKYYCKILNINITHTEYTNNVICKIELENRTKEKLLNYIDTKKINIMNINILCKKYISKSIEK